MFLINEDFATTRLIQEFEAHNGLIIGVDFDDTIYDFHQRGFIEDITKVVELLKDLQNNFGCTLCVWSANRDESHVKAEWDRLGLRIDYYNESPMKKFNPSKPYFNVLLDDRAGLDSTFKQLIKVRDYALEQNKLKETK